MLNLVFSIDANPIIPDLLAASGLDREVKVYDKRNSKIVRKFKDVHGSDNT